MSPSEKKLDPSGSTETQDNAELLSQAYFRDKNVAYEGKGVGDASKTILWRLAKYFIPIVVLLAATDLILKAIFPPDELLPFMARELSFYSVKVDHFLSRPPQDVLILGSSRTRKGVNSQVFAEELSKYWGRPARVYNLALDGAMVEEVHCLVTSHIPVPPPTHVVICLSGVEVTQAYDFNYAARFLWRFPDFIDYLLNTSFDDFQVNKVEYYIESILCRIWYLFEHRDTLSDMLALNLECLLGMKGADSEAAARERSGKILASLVLAEDGYFAEDDAHLNFAEWIRKNPGKAPRFGEKRLALDRALLENNKIGALGRTIARLREEGCKVILAEIPASPTSQKARPLMEGDEFRVWMAEQTRKLGVPFIPFPTEETALTDDLYRDATHLSSRGAQQYTYALFNELRDAGFFAENDL